MGLFANPDFDFGHAFYDVHGEQIRLLVPPIPPSGYQMVTHHGALVNHMHMAHTDANEARLAAGRFSARLDPTQGTIAALRVAGQVSPEGTTVPAVAEAVDVNAPYGFGEILYERFDSNQVAAFVSAYVKSTAHWATNELRKPMLPPTSVSPYQAVSPTNFTATYRSSFFAAEAILTAPASEAVPFGVTTHYLFYNGLPWFDLEVTLHKKPADPWPEAAWICLPFKLEDPQFRLGRLGGIVDPARDLVRPALEARYPIQAVSATGKGGPIPTSGQGIGLRRSSHLPARSTGASLGRLSLELRLQASLRKRSP